MSALIGNYLLNKLMIETFIGRGGMAKVHKIWDLK